MVDIEKSALDEDVVQLEYAGRDRRPVDAPLWFKIVVSAISMGLFGLAVLMFIAEFL